MKVLLAGAFFSVAALSLAPQAHAAKVSANSKIKKNCVGIRTFNC